MVGLLSASRKPLSNLFSNCTASIGQRLRVRTGRSIQVVTVGSAKDIEIVFGGLGHGGSAVGHTESVPRINCACRIAMRGME